MKTIFRTQKQGTNEQGFILLIAVVIVAAMSASIVTTLLLLGIGSVRSGLAVEHGQKARDIADGCAQEALHRLVLDTAYTGNETITIDADTCDIETVTGTGDSNRVIEASAVHGAATKRVRVEVTSVGPPAVIGQWEEVADF